MDAPERTRPRAGQGGFSLPELLIVLAIIGLGLTMAIPLVADQMKAASARGAADQFTVDLRAARMIAVTKRMTNNFVIAADPTNTYQYTDRDGTTRTIRMPKGVRISSTSPTTISFRQDGSVSATGTTVIEIAVGGGVERWTVTTSSLGMPSATRQRVSS